MASPSKSRTAFNVLQDDSPGVQHSTTGTSSHSEKKNTTDVLRDLAVDQSQNTVHTPGHNTLATDFEKFHIHSPKRVEVEGILRTSKTTKAARQSRVSIKPDTFEAPDKAARQKHAHFDIPSAPCLGSLGEELESTEGKISYLRIYPPPEACSGDGRC